MQVAGGLPVLASGGGGGGGVASTVLVSATEASFGGAESVAASCAGAVDGFDVSAAASAETASLSSSSATSAPFAHAPRPSESEAKITSVPRKPFETLILGEPYARCLSGGNEGGRRFVAGGRTFPPGGFVRLGRPDLTLPDAARERPVAYGSCVHLA